MNNSIDNFKVREFKSWPEYFDFLSSAKSSMRDAAWQWPSGIANFFSTPVTESAQASQDRKNGKKFSEAFKSYDKRNAVILEIGNTVSIISSTLDLDKKRISVRGYLTPRVIAAINYDDDGSIDCIEFTNGEQFPERNELTVVDGQYITNTIFFASAAESEEAYTKIWMDISRMEGTGWKYSNYLEESKIQPKELFT